MSLLTGYLVQATGPTCSTLYYLTQVDPRGELVDTDGTVLPLRQQLQLTPSSSVPSCLLLSSSVPSLSPIGDITGSLPKWVVNRVSQFVAPKVKSSSSSSSSVGAPVPDHVTSACLRPLRP